MADEPKKWTPGGLIAAAFKAAGVDLFPEKVKPEDLQKSPHLKTADKTDTD